MAELYTCKLPKTALRKRRDGFQVDDLFSKTQKTKKNKKLVLETQGQKIEFLIQPEFEKSLI